MELSNYCEHNSLDVIAISEILPKFSLFQPEETNYSLDGFDIFTSDLTSGRGCALFVKQDLAATKITFTSNFSESVWCQINLKNNDKMIVGCIYRSPNSTIENNKVQVGKDQEKAQSEKDSHSKNRVGKKPNQQSGTYTMKHIVSRMSSYFPNRWPLSYLNLTKNMKTYIRRQQHKKF